MSDSNSDFFDIFNEQGSRTAAIGGAVGGVIAGLVAGIVIGLFLCCCMRMAASKSEDEVYTDRHH